MLCTTRTTAPEAGRRDRAKLRALIDTYRKHGSSFPCKLAPVDGKTDARTARTLRQRLVGGILAASANGRRRMITDYRGHTRRIGSLRCSYAFPLRLNTHWPSIIDPP